MFQLGQIISASKFLRKFVLVCDYLDSSQEPALIARKSGSYLVLMKATDYERLVFENMKLKGCKSESSFLRDYIEQPKL